MANFLEIPIDRLDGQVLQALLEEFATRDGTDYGEVETTIDQRVQQLMRGLVSTDLALLYDSESEQWDLLPRDAATELLDQ